MNRTAFDQLLIGRLPEGLAMQNPGRGTSTVMWCDGKRICYKRGRLRLYIDLGNLYQAYCVYRGQDVTTNDLKGLDPTIFDSMRNGHNCHCTFFFMALREMGITYEIWGTGRRGKPFGVSLPA